MRQLVEAHGGTIDAESSGVGQGATFTVVLPAAGAAARRPADPIAWGPVDLRGSVVLVVDDDVDSYDLTRTLLEKAGATVLTSRTAQGGLDLLRREPVDVLLADLAMPGNDGLWLIRQIRGDGHGAIGRLPAVALTAYASLRDRQAALAAGYDAHIATPFDTDALIAAIGRRTRS